MQNRVHSRDPQHHAFDLRLALNAAIEVTGTCDDGAYGRVITSITLPEQSPDSMLRSVLHEFDAEIFGLVLRFSIEAETSLRGYSEVLSRSRELRELRGLGLELRDLRWPAEVLHAVYADDAAPADTDREAHWAELVEKAWAALHPEEGVSAATPAGIEVNEKHPDEQRIRAQAVLDFADVLTRKGVYLFDIHDIRRYARDVTDSVTR